MKRQVSALALGLVVAGTKIFVPRRANHSQTRLVDSLRLYGLRDALRAIIEAEETSR